LIASEERNARRKALTSKGLEEMMDIEGIRKKDRKVKESRQKGGEQLREARQKKRGGIYGAWEKSGSLRRKSIKERKREPHREGKGKISVR